nr:uncharacterized protein LOC128686628 isoform X1 [Cherax quadricarinatus]
MSAIVTWFLVVVLVTAAACQDSDGAGGTINETEYVAVNLIYYNVVDDVPSSVWQTDAAQVKFSVASGLLLKNFLLSMLPTKYHTFAMNTTFAMYLLPQEVPDFLQQEYALVNDTAQQLIALLKEAWARLTVNWLTVFEREVPALHTKINLLVTENSWKNLQEVAQAVLNLAKVLDPVPTFKDLVNFIDIKLNVKAKFSECYLKFNKFTRGIDDYIAMTQLSYAKSGNKIMEGVQDLVGAILNRYGLTRSSRGKTEIIKAFDYLHASLVDLSLNIFDTRKSPFLTDFHKITQDYADFKATLKADALEVLQNVNNFFQSLCTAIKCSFNLFINPEFIKQVAEPQTMFSKTEHCSLMRNNMKFSTRIMEMLKGHSSILDNYKNFLEYGVSFLSFLLEILKGSPESFDPLEETDTQHLLPSEEDVASNYIDYSPDYNSVARSLKKSRLPTMSIILGRNGSEISNKISSLGTNSSKNKNYFSLVSSRMQTKETTQSSAYEKIDMISGNLWSRGRRELYHYAPVATQPPDMSDLVTDTLDPTDEEEPLTPRTTSGTASKEDLESLPTTASPPTTLSASHRQDSCTHSDCKFNKKFKFSYLKL